jgi:hypothetical protein
MARSTLGSKAGSTTRSRGLRLTLRTWTRRRRRRGGVEEEDWGLGLLQEKQRSTTPSPAGPAPIPQWRLDHGRIRLGRRRPWLGLLRLRSGHARADGDEDARLRPPPRMALPQRSSSSLLPPSLIPVRRWMDWGIIPHRRRGSGRVWLGRLLVGWLLGFEGASGRCRCGTGGTRRPSGAPALQGVAAMGPARCSRRLPCPTASARERSQREREKVGKEGADRLGPHGGETRREVGGRRAGWVCWAERHGGLRLRRTR